MDTLSACLLGIIIGMVGEKVFNLISLKLSSQTLEVTDESSEDSNLPDPHSMPILPPQAYFDLRKKEMERSLRFAHIKNEMLAPRFRGSPPPFESPLFESDAEVFFPFPMPPPPPPVKVEYEDNVIKVEFRKKEHL